MRLFGNASKRFKAMVSHYSPLGSGERGYNLHVARRRVNEAFLRDLLADWQQHGAEIIRQVARESPATYLKVMAMLMPKEMKIESTREVVGRLSDDQLAAMISELQEQIAKRVNGEDAKLIEGKPVELVKPDKPWRPRRTRKAAKALKAIAADCETNNHSLPSQRAFEIIPEFCSRSCRANYRKLYSLLGEADRQPLCCAF